MTLSVAFAAACAVDTPSLPNTASGFALVETVDVRRRLFELDQSVPVVLEALVAGEETNAVIVLLPDRGLGAIDFLAFMPRLVDAGYRPVALNPRGVEASEGPLGGLTLHDLAADIAGVIESLDVGPVHVLGHGFGNRVARCVAADRPDLVRSVILMAADGQVPGDGEAHGAMERLFQPARPESERLADLQTALFAPASDASVWLDLLMWTDAQRAQDDADRATPREEWLAGGTAPILVIQGRHDRLAPPANGRWLREHLGERVDLVELANSGHALFPEQPNEIIEAIRRFTARLD